MNFSLQATAKSVLAGAPKPAREGACAPQRPKSEGLGAAFGGGVTENIFGAQTTNVLTKVGDLQESRKHQAG